MDFDRCRCISNINASNLATIVKVNNNQGKQTKSTIMENTDFSKQDCSLNVYNEASKRGKKECKSAAGNCKNAAVGFLFMQLMMIGEPVQSTKTSYCSL